jgi:hypothetical protein
MSKPTFWADNPICEEKGGPGSLFRYAWSVTYPRGYLAWLVGRLPEPKSGTWGG